MTIYDMFDKAKTFVFFYKWPLICLGCYFAGSYHVVGKIAKALFAHVK